MILRSMLSSFLASLFFVHNEKGKKKEKEIDEGIFGFSKAIVGDSSPGGPVCHVRVTCCTIPSILTRFWAQGVTAEQLD